MGIATLKGRNVKVEIALTTATAKTVTAVTKATQGIAASTAHGLVDGTIGYFDAVTGMVELDGMAQSVTAKTTDNFTLEKLDTTSYTTYGTGTFVPAATWGTLGTVTSFELSGGDATKLDSTTLLDVVKQEENGMLGAQSVTFGALVPAAAHAAFDAVDAAAVSGAYLVFRATFPNGYRVIWRGQPSLPGLSAQMDANITTGFNSTVKGRALRLPPA